MLTLLIVALVNGHQELAPEPVRGVALRDDGSAAWHACVALRCGDWRRERVTDAEGTFVFEHAPQGPCSVAAHSRENASAGVSTDVPAIGNRRVSVSLPAGTVACTHVS
jgi:hypothetical protein